MTDWLERSFLSLADPLLCFSDLDLGCTQSCYLTNPVALRGVQLPLCTPWLAEENALPAVGAKLSQALQYSHCLESALSNPICSFTPAGMLMAPVVC